MAARMLQRRILSLFSRNQPSTSLLELKDRYAKYLPPANAAFSHFEVHKRGIQSQAEPTSQESQDIKNHEASSSSPESALSSILSGAPGDTSASMNYSVTSKLKISARHDLAVVFTCKVCETRSVKLICRQSYEKGVVVVRCGGCNNNHLIVDRLGWFGEPGSIEDFLAARGEEVKRGSVDSMNFTVEDLVGRNSQE